jgi:hypothetical protein
MTEIAQDERGRVVAFVMTGLVGMFAIVYEHDIRLKFPSGNSIDVAPEKAVGIEGACGLLGAALAAEGLEPVCEVRYVPRSHVTRRTRASSRAPRRGCASARRNNAHFSTSRSGIAASTLTLTQHEPCRSRQKEDHMEKLTEEELKEQLGTLAQAKERVKEIADLMSPRDLVLGIHFTLEDLDSGRFTDEELLQGIAYINKFGEGIEGFTHGFDDDSISTIVMNSFLLYMEREFGDVADARCIEQTPIADQARSERAQGKAVTGLGI